MPDPFESSRRKIARANKHIADFDEQMHVFLETAPREPLIEPDLHDPHHVVHKVRFTKGLPDSLIDSAADAVTNLRSALDNAGYELAVSSGKVRPLHTAFPFAGGAVEFEDSIKGRCKDIPKEVYPVFRAFKPYKGGDDFFWAFNKVANAHKHTLLRVNLGTMLGNFSGEGGIVRMHLNPPWDRLKNEIEVGTFVRDSHVKYEAELAFFISFDEVDILSGEPALKLLEYWADKTERVLMALKSEGRRLGLIK